MTEVTRIDATAEMLRRLAQRAIFSPGTQRAFVAVQDAHYGLTRMFQVFCELEGTRVEIFRDIRTPMPGWIPYLPLRALGRGSILEMSPYENRPGDRGGSGAGRRRAPTCRPGPGRGT